MEALIPLFIQLIPVLVKGGEAGVQFIESFREAARQTQQWTDDHEAAYQAQLDAANSAPESLTDAERGGL